MGKFNYLWFRNILLLSAGMWGLAVPYAVADDKMKESPITEQVRTKIQVSGVVVDSNGEPLIGATIREKESGNGTITDVDGKFTLSIPVDAVIVVSYVGYRDKLIAVNGKTSFKIELEDDTETLGEVVVVGYGIQKKANLSGSVDQITSTQLEQRPMTDLSKGLQGMVPNLNVDFTSGEPGQAANINIRGEASINGGSPLILIDGVASDAEEMNRLLPEDVESLSVLKDASSAAIYGARAAFGVVLITTKQGKGDRIQVNYNNNFSWKRPSSLTEKTSDPYIYLKLKNIAVLNTPWSSGHVTSDERLEWARQRSDNPDGTEAIRLNPLDNTQWEYMGNRNWTNYFLDKSTFSQAHQLSISGATEKTKFYLSGGVDSEDGVFSGVVKNDKYIRYSMRGKVNYQIWNWLSVSNNTSFVSTTRKKPSYYNLSDFYDAEPHDMDVNPDGTWANSELGIALAQLVDGGEEKTVYDRLQSTFSAEMNFWERMLVLNANFTFSKSHEDYDWYKTKYRIGYGPDDVREQGTSRAYKGSTSELYTVLDLYATLTKSFDKHLVSGVLGFNQEYSRWDKFTADRYDIISTSLPSIGLSSGEQYVDETYKDWAIRGLFFRANYMYDNRYIFELNGRYDGTSRFPKKDRFGFFPSGSVAWVLSKEKFMENINQSIGLDMLKFRASYGALGNQNVGTYAYLPTMSSGQIGQILDGSQPVAVYAPGVVSNTLTWEKVRTINGGIDLALLNNRLSASFDYYVRYTEGMLTKSKTLPSVFGASEPKTNAADLKTKGWELSLRWRDQFMLADSPFNYSIKVALADSRAFITKYDNPNKRLGDYYEGQEIGEMWGLTTEGFFQTEEEIKNHADQSAVGEDDQSYKFYVGDLKFADLNNDGKINKGDWTLANPGDFRKIGNSSSRYPYSFDLSADWKGFDIRGFFQGIGKRDWYAGGGNHYFWGIYAQPWTNVQTHNLDHWTPENPNAYYPRVKAYIAESTGSELACVQTRYMQDASYLRMKNLTIGYTLPQDLTRKLNIERVRFYFSGENLFEITHLKANLDPEALDSSSKVYPLQRSYSFGVNLTF